MTPPVQSMQKEPQEPIHSSSPVAVIATQYWEDAASVYVGETRLIVQIHLINKGWNGKNILALALLGLVSLPSTIATHRAGP